MPKGADFIRGLEAQPAVSAQQRNTLAAARTRLLPQSRNGGGRVLRQGFEHLRGYSRAQGCGEPDLDAAFPDRGYGMDVLLAEGDQVWMRFSVSGTHRGALCGIAPTGRRVGVHAVTLMNFSGGRCVDRWMIADEFGLLLQLGQPDLFQ